MSLPPNVTKYLFKALSVDKKKLFIQETNSKTSCSQGNSFKTKDYFEIFYKGWKIKKNKNVTK